MTNIDADNKTTSVFTLKSPESLVQENIEIICGINSSSDRESQEKVQNFKEPMPVELTTLARKSSLSKLGGIHRHGLSGLYLGLLINKQRSKAERGHQELEPDDELSQHGPR